MLIGTYRLCSRKTRATQTASHSKTPMTTTHPNRLYLLALSIGVISLPTDRAQTLPIGQALPSEEHQGAQSPLCDPDLIDTTFTFVSLPAGAQTVSLHFQNKSSAACRLHGALSPSFAVDSHSIFVDSCWLCDQDHASSLAPGRDPGNEIQLAPGERARLDLQWESAGPSCQWADWVNFYVRWAATDRDYFYLFIPSEWPIHVCSWVMSTGYRAEADSPSNGESGARLRISVAPAPIYSDEWTTLHVELFGQIPSVAPEGGCATLYRVLQEPSIGTRLDPLRTMGSSSGPSYTPEQIEEDKERAWPPWKRDHLRTCAIPAGRATADADITAAELAAITHVEWRTASPPGENPVFVMADTHFSVLDVDTLAPNWGDPVGGIRAGLSIDRPSFSMGERVPLHLRWENVNAAMPLGRGECWEPQPSLEIQDSQHNVVQTIPHLPGCMGHGWGPFAIPKGEPHRTFIELATEPSTVPASHTYVRGYVAATLPGPGVYYLVSVWTPVVLEQSAPDTDKTPRIGSSGRFGNAYATARSLPVRIEVARGNHP